MDKDLQHYLEGFLLPERIQRLKEVIQNRTQHATIVLEDIYQSQNASAILRTAECFGLSAVHIIENKHKYNINKQVVRGANKWMDIKKYNASNNSVEQCFHDLKNSGYSIVATDPGEDACLLTDLDVNQKTAFVFGTEKFGVSKEALKYCDKKIKIPMYGFTESFNVSVSTAICLFHFIGKAREKNIQLGLSNDEQEELLHAWTLKSIYKSNLLVQEFYTNHRGKNSV